MDDNKKLQQGFNAGYLLAKEKPELLKAITDGLQKTNDPYVQGLLAGSEEYSKEMAQPSKSKALPKFKGKFHQNYQLKEPKGRGLENPDTKKEMEDKEPDMDME